MMGGSRGRTGRIRSQQSHPGRAGHGGDGIRVVGESALVEALGPIGPGADGLSIAQRRAGALMARANEPQGARRVILDLAFISGQPIGDIERLRVSEVPYVTDLLKKTMRHG